jgi:hypothetical protein
MSLWHEPGKRPHPAGHPLSFIEVSLIAGGLFLAVLVGIAATGRLPGV